MPMQPEPRIAVFESVVVMATATRFTAASMDALDRIHERLKRSYPGRVSFLIVRDPNSEPSLSRGLDHHARERGAELVRKNGKHMLGLAYVYDDGGFVSALIRMLLSSMSRIAPFNAGYFRHIDEAVTWICALSGQPPAVRDGRQQLIELAENLGAELRLARAG